MNRRGMVKGLCLLVFFALLTQGLEEEMGDGWGAEWTKVVQQESATAIRRTTQTLHSLAQTAHLDRLRVDTEITLSVINNVLLIIGILGRVMANRSRETYASIRQHEAIDASRALEKMRRSKCKLIGDIGSSLSERLDQWAIAELQAVELVLKESTWCSSLANRSPWCRMVESFDYGSYLKAMTHFGAAISSVKRTWEILQCKTRPGLDNDTALAFCNSYTESETEAKELCRVEMYWFELPATSAEFCHLFCDMAESNTLREWPNWLCMHHMCLPVVQTREPRNFESKVFNYMYEEMEGIEEVKERIIEELGGGVEEEVLSSRVGSGQWWDAWEMTMRQLLPIDALQKTLQKEILAGGDLLGEISEDLEKGVYLGSFDADTQPEILFGGVLSPLFTAMGWRKAETCANLAIWAGTMRLAASGIQLNSKRIQQQKGVKADARALQSLQKEATEDFQHGICTILSAVHQMNMEGLSLVNASTPLQLKGIVGGRGGLEESERVNVTLVLGTRAKLQEDSARAVCTEVDSGTAGTGDIVEVLVFASKARSNLHSDHPHLQAQGFLPAGVLTSSRSGRPLSSLWVRRGGSSEGELPVTRVVVTRARGGREASEDLAILVRKAEDVFEAAVSPGKELSQGAFSRLLREGTLVRSPACPRRTAFGSIRPLEGQDVGDGGVLPSGKEGGTCHSIFSRYDSDKSAGLNKEEFMTSFWELSVVKLSRMITSSGNWSDVVEEVHGRRIWEAEGNREEMQQARKFYNLFGWNVWQIYEHAAPVTELHVEKEGTSADKSTVAAQSPKSWISLHHHFCPFNGLGGDASIDNNCKCFVYFGDYKTSIRVENRISGDPQLPVPFDRADSYDSEVFWESHGRYAKEQGQFAWD